MANRKLLICDKDAAYVEALTAYLMHTLKGFSITTYTDTDAFAYEEETYRISLMGEDFLELLPETKEEKERFGVILYLCAKVGDDRFGEYPAIFKFQQMQTFVRTVFSYAQMNAADETAGTQAAKRWIGVHSPIRHELQLPFAIAYARKLTEQGSVLFLDMETNSIMEELIDCGESKSLIDALYISEETGGAEIRGLTDYYEGISYLAPMRNFGEAAQVENEQWIRLFQAVDRTDYDMVVVLFDDGLQCVRELMEHLSELILLYKPGDYYHKSRHKVMRYIDTMEDAPTVRDINLAMSGSNLTDGTYRFEQLLQGNLGRFVATTFA